MKRVIILNFLEASKAYQAFSEIKMLAAERKIAGDQMAVVTHEKENDKFKIQDFIDFTGQQKTAKDSFIGLLIGLLAGPAGMLFGWLTGSIIGSVQDAEGIKNAQNIFTNVYEKIDAGATGVILIAEEDDNRPLNQLVMTELQGEISRLSYEEVEAQIKAAREKKKTQQEEETKKTSAEEVSHKEKPAENNAENDNK
ncbi:DUF1269 domain-containing protein [Enterococcus hirae]|nr:DUF1269 domain-containing protein [Enterococcus hirae]